MGTLLLFLLAMIGLAVAGGIGLMLRSQPGAPNAEALQRAWTRLDAIERRIATLEADVIDRFGKDPSKPVEEPATAGTGE